MDAEEQEFRSPKKRKLMEDNDDRMIDISGPKPLLAKHTPVGRSAPGPAPTDEIVVVSGPEEKRALLESLPVVTKKQKKAATQRAVAALELEKEQAEKLQKENSMDV